ncbi:MAG: pilus assembly protein [Planctomycetota bacterium]|nr:MAG: pilus assembly protein [Planctomycetota bacterium]
MAVVTPLLMTMLFGIIEFGWMFTVKNTMVNAAREGARVGALQGSEYADIYGRVVELLQPMGLDNKVTITIVDGTQENPVVRVDLSVPQADVSLVGNFFGMVTGNIEATASMREEGM